MKVPILKTRVHKALGIREDLMRIPVSEIEFKEHLPSLPRKDLIEKYAGMPKETRPAILVFGKRFKGDTYQVFQGHHRTLAAKRRREKQILAWVTKVNKQGRPIL